MFYVPRVCQECKIMHLFRPIEASTLASMLRPIAVTPDQVEDSEDPEADHEEDDSKRRHLL